MKEIPDIFNKFKHVLKFKFLNSEYELEKRNNDRIYYKEIKDYHLQDGDIGTGDRLSRISEGTAHKTGQLWGTTFRFYNFLKWFKSSNQTILDIGCDDSFIRKMIHSGTYYSGTNYIGLDIKVRSLRKASDLMPRCGNPSVFVACDLYEGLPFIRKNSTDIIICMEIIEHLDEEHGVKLMKEMYRILKPGGKIYMSHPNHDPSYWYVWRKHRSTGYPWHLREYTEKEFLNMIKKYHFKLIDHYGNLSQRRRLLKVINESDLKTYNRLIDIMGPEIPTQIIGQLYPYSCGGMVYIFEKPK